MRGPSVLCVLCTAVLLLEPTLAGVGEAQSVAVDVAKCSRNSPEMKLLRQFPGPVQDFVMSVGVEHGDSLQRMLERHIPQRNLDALKSIPGKIIANVLTSRATTDGTVVLLEEGSGLPEMRSCILVGVLATVCTLFSLFIVYRLFFNEAYVRHVTNNSHQVTFEEFSDFSEGVYKREVASNSKGKPTSEWALPPPDFSEAQTGQFREFLLENKQPPAELRSKFEMRRQQLKKAYELFLRSRLYWNKPADGQLLTKVILPASLYLCMHVFAYVSAYRIGRST